MPLSQEMMLTPIDISSLRSLTPVDHVSCVNNAAAGAGVIVLAHTVPVVSQPTTSLQVVDEEAQDVAESATQVVRQELKVLVLHSSEELELTLLGSLLSVKSAKFKLVQCNIGRIQSVLPSSSSSSSLSSSSSPMVSHSGPKQSPGGQPSGPHPPPW